jgi:L-lactate dehydrogenase complex protein LldG
MSSRDKILATLRANQPPFPDVSPRPDAYRPVTRFDDEDLLTRFTQEAEIRTGQVHVSDPQNAIGVVLKLLEADKTVLAWDNLPLPGLAEALAEHKIEVLPVQARHENRIPALEGAEKIRVGITGADAAFATTGTLALVTQKGHGRVTSLLPPVHIALLQRDRLVERLEDWFAGDGREALKQSSSIALVTGPSSTGDIERYHVLGAHGPRVVHIVVF